MRLRPLLISLFVALLAPLAAAQAQRGAPVGGWELLGEQTVGFGVDNDSIQIRQNEEWFRNRAFRALRFAAERNDVRLLSIRIHYLNGFSEEMNIDKVIRRGGRLDIVLPGERSFLKQVDMRYRSNNLGISIGQGGIRLQQAVIKVFGERITRRPEALVPPDRGGWEEIDTARLEWRDEQVVLGSGRGDGRFGQLKLRAVGEPVRIRNIAIRFRNGETQAVSLNRRLERGEETAAIDLQGRQRLIDRVTVTVGERRRPGPVELQLLGMRRPGGSDDVPPSDPYADRGWQLLGEQTVGPMVDRDVINIGQSEEWFRNRAYRALHFVSERSDVHVMKLQINFLNGYGEEYSVDRLIEAGRELTVDLPGGRSYLRSIELIYRAVGGGRRGPAVVKVYGEPVRR